MIEQSESIAALATALAITQGSVEGALKGKENPAFKGTKYADLRSVWDACREPLCANGLSVAQFPGQMIDNRMTMTTQLMHKSGEWMRGTLSIPLSKADAQGYGSAVTYARRYALAAVVGVCPEDDDGNAASQRPKQTAANEPEYISHEQRDILMALLRTSKADWSKFAVTYKIDDLRDMLASDYELARGQLNKKIASLKSEAA